MEHSWLTMPLLFWVRKLSFLNNTAHLHFFYTEKRLNECWLLIMFKFCAVFLSSASRMFSFLFIYSHFSKYMSWLKIITFQRPINKSILRLTILYCEGLCFKCLILCDAVLSDAQGEKWHNNRPQVSRLFLGIILVTKTETFISKLGCNQKISHPLFPLVQQVPVWCLISYFSYAVAQC